MKKFLLLILLLSGIEYAHAQSSHIKFDHFTVKEGLPERQIQFLKQDDQGYIWVGTQNGLLRYDGYKPKVYRFGTGKNTISPNCSARSMLIDKNKNIWIATVGNGLFRYNRQTDSFTEFPYPQKPGQRENYISYLADVDSDNNLWLFYANLNGPNYGIATFDLQTGKYEFYNKDQKGSHHLDINNADFIYKSSDGTIWLGTDNGLYSYKNKTLHAYLSATDVKHSVDVGMIYQPPSQPGIIWLNVFDHFSKKASIVRFDTRSGIFKYFNHEINRRLTSSNDTVSVMHEDKMHRLWFGTQQGLLLYDPKTESFSLYKPGDADKEPNGNAISEIVETNTNSLWLNSGKGLLNFDLSTFQFKRYINDPNDPYSLSANRIENIMLDRSGMLWAGISGRGIDHINPLTSAFVVESKNADNPFSYPGGLPALFQITKDGYTWFSNKSGIYKWKGGTSKFEQIYKAPGHANLRGFDISEDGKYLYFSDGSGFQEYNITNHKKTSYPASADTASISSNVISIIRHDHTGLVWIGTSDKGICTFDPVLKKVKRYPFIVNDGSMDGKGALDDQRVLSIYEDKQGTIWTGTNFGGLSRFDRKTGKFKSYLNAGNQLVTCVSDIFQGSDGRFWISTYLDGLFEFDSSTEKFIKHFNENNGLTFNTCAGLLEDKKGFIWVANERGFSRIDTRSMTLKNFPLNSILPGKTLNPYDFSFCNNLIVFGLLDGVGSFNTDDLADNPHTPVVHIEKVGYSDPGAASDSSTYLQAYGSHGIELPHNQNRITFNYVALHFVNSAQNKYAYLLEGYDKQWVQAGTQRNVTYTNLSPGTYTFKVRASNSDGVWNNKGDSFLVIIDSPWWQTWWAWVIYVVVFVAAISAFVTYRSRQLRRENQELEQKIAERTKQLSEANKELNEQQEEIITQRDNLANALGELKTTQSQLVQREKLASLGELTAGIAHEIQNPLNFVNNFAEVSVELVDELADELSNKRDPQTEEDLITDLKQNLEKISHHGKRADGIVKNMLQHSSGNSGARQLTDINTLADEYLRLSYHGLRAKDSLFNSATVTALDSNLPQIKVITQDIGRVLLNLFNNAFYAVQQKQKAAGPDYKPEVSVTTLSENGNAVIKVKDNGMGIPDAIKEKIMQPFFTTKPTGEGTGLGLSLTYDIVVKGHGGKIEVDTKEGEFTEFTVYLPI